LQRILIIVLTAVLIIAGCNQPSTQKMKSQQATAECKSVPIRHFTDEQRAEFMAQSVTGVDKATAVMIDQELNVALQVTNFDRLRLNSLRKEVSKQLKEKYPKANIHVTTDSKLYRDLQELSDKPWPSGDKNKGCQQKNKLKQVEEDMKG
jgi:PBP1b-binding outer membrane lipoprotein LpoB